MGVKCTILKLLLFQTLVAWSGAKNIDSMFRVQGDAELKEEVQSTIKNILHNGIYSHEHLDPSQAQVTVPIKVTHAGELVSRHVDHDHEHGHARARRDLHMREHEVDHVVHYNLTVDGRDLRLDLRPSVTFITPAMIVERHTAEGRTRRKPDNTITSCHYSGSIRGQPGSSIAISACDGLAGLLNTEHGEYWIEPSNLIPEDKSEGRAHLIFKRSAVNKVKALRRNKRAVNNTNYNQYQSNHTKYVNYNRNKYSRSSNRNRVQEAKEIMDRRRREYLEARRRHLERLRTNPTEYRRHMHRLQLEQRRIHTNSSQSNSASNSLESQKPDLMKKRNKNKNKLTLEQRRKKKLKRRRRRAKNCATKEPPYQWDKKDEHGQNYVNHMLHRNKNRRRLHHHQLSHHLDFTEGRRSARSVSKPRHVEVLLVADWSMTDFHKNKSLEMYLLTIMNIVSELYMKPSIGNYIKVVVVKIVLVENMHEGAPGLLVSTRADGTLDSFCKWQQQLNPNDDADPHHHDVAILVTREDICGQNDPACSTLGVAYVAGMCKQDKSCSVNEDNGIMLAHTITHELGHNFGLYHDTEQIGCHRREGTTLHIMTPVFEADTGLVDWSKCSKRDVTNFLDTGSGECLVDTPSQDYEYPVVPAGVIFNATTQCQLQFGANATLCTEPDEICKTLWCMVNETCTTMLRPAAPGTTCGVEMWCENLRCVARAPTPTPRHGGWGPWSEWSECSRTCEAGVQTKSRECNNPEPQNNGQYCIGERSRYKICNTNPCPIGEPSFRAVQCHKYNKNETDDWVPYFDQDKPCELMCTRIDDDKLENGGFVADGTSCRQTDGARDICIAGVCHKVSCDWIVDSEVEEDACGVCGGNGSACKTVQGIYNKGTTKQSGFSEVAVIPAGSRNVRIKEKVNPGNYISIGSAKTKKLYLTGARNEALTQYVIAGSQAIYERDRDWEKVRIPGPIAEDLRVYQHIYRGKNRNPVVTYKYTVDRAVPLRAAHRYSLSEWSACSVTCGVGVMRRTVQCRDQHDRLVEQSKCYYLESPRNEALMQRCRRSSCPYTNEHEHSRANIHDYAYAHNTHWWVGQWNTCSSVCKMPGKESVKQRNVYCVDKTLNRIIDDSSCDPSTKPLHILKCADVPPC